MFPLLLDMNAQSVVLAGRGERLIRRLALLDEAGTQNLRVFCDAPDADVIAAAGARLEQRLPNAADIHGITLLFLTGLSEDEAGAIAEQARAYKVLVNSEDQPALCDFHVPAIVRRGDLTLTVSTNGAAPGLASRLRQDLEQRFGPEWAAHVTEVARERARLRSKGVSPADVRRRIDDMVGANGWLS